MPNTPIYDQDPYASNANAGLTSGIASAYTKYLGRAANPDEIAFHARTSPTNYEDVIKNSSEAQKWTASQAAPAGGYDYGKAQSSWYNSAPGTSVDAWIAANPSFTQGITSSRNGEWMNLPGGQSFDAVRDKGGANAPQWGSQNYDYATGRAYTPAEAAAAEAQWASQHGGGSLGASTGANGASASTTDFSATSAPATQDAALRAQLIAQLTQRAAQGLAVSGNDPNIQQQVDPFRAEQDRASRTFLSQLAEKAGQNYGASNLEGQARLANEQAGQNVGNFQSTLIGKELDAKRKEISDALTSMGNLLTEEQRQQLTAKLAQLNDATQRLGIQTGANTAAQRLGFDYSGLDWQTSPLNPANIRNFNSAA